MVIYLILSGLVLFMASAQAAAEGYINIEIVNDGQYDQRIAVVDNICHLLVLERRIIADGLMPAQVCSRKMNRGNVTLRNLESGAEREFPNVLDGDQLNVP
ncbi:MAG: hypothetical protein C1943_14645 [Halochromatium sp.]|nr:hypothetical protein [Halochromatium sp.]